MSYDTLVIFCVISHFLWFLLCGYLVYRLALEHKRRMQAEIDVALWKHWCYEARRNTLMRFLRREV